MSKIVINAEPRTIIGKQVRQLRRDGKVPAVIYGHNIEPQPITMDFKEASKKLEGLTTSSLIEIQLEGQNLPVIVRERQMNYIRAEIIHVDFQKVSLTEKLRTNVVIVLDGVAPAIKDFDATLVNGISEIEVEAFPQDLPEKFVVDISNIKNIGDAIHVKDIQVPDNVAILSDMEEMIVLATTTVLASEEEFVPTEAEPDVIEKGKKEEEE